MKARWNQMSVFYGMVMAMTLVMTETPGLSFQFGGVLIDDGDAPAAVKSPAGVHCTNPTAWTKHTVTSDAIAAGECVPADFNGDGFMDLVGAATQVQQVTWWQNVDGTGTNWTSHPIGGNFGGVYHLAVGDIDGDNDMDVVVSVNEEHDIILYINASGDGLTWTAITVDGFFGDPISVTMADVDGNGIMDIAAVGESGGVAWWRNHFGNGFVWFKTPVDDTFIWAFGVSVADIDGDNDHDIVASSRTLHEISWWENTDAIGGTWSRHLIKSGAGGARPVFAADLDHDGDMDVVSSPFGAIDLFWYENENGDGLTWTSHLLDADFGAFSLFVTDLDRDGNNDILGAGRGEDTLAWWDNVNGNGTSFVRNDIDTFMFNTTSINAADMDGDNDLDILGTSNDCDDFAWYEQPGSLPPLCTADVTGDDEVNVSDLLDLLAAWGFCTAPCPEDINGSGTVNVTDLLDLLAGWGPCPI